MSELKEAWESNDTNLKVRKYTSNFHAIQLLLIEAGMMCDSRGDYVQHYFVMVVVTDSPPNIAPPSIEVLTKPEIKFQYNLDIN
jgi:hypothetical protein